MEITEKDIPWEVGQEVWDVVLGKGKVSRVLEKQRMYPVRVIFCNDLVESYDLHGKKSDKCNRSLFFSEPVITAERFPQKKPFTPTLKNGEKVVLDTGDRSFIATIKEEKEDEVLIERQVSGIRYPKNCIKIYKLGEEVKL